MPLWFTILIVGALGLLFGFFAGVWFGSAQRRVDHILDQELYHPLINDQSAEDLASATCLLDESNDMEAFAALPECQSCGGLGKDVPEDFWGGRP